MTAPNADQRPAPPIPCDLDLRSFQDMPLEVTRVINSELAALPNPEAFRGAVISWCVSWHQVPAGSLPVDDAALARLLGYGRDVKGWKRARAAGALRGWVEHSDGKLYHPVVTVKVLAAYARKIAAKEKREADNQRMRDYRETKAERRALRSASPDGHVARHVDRDGDGDVTATDRLRAERSGADLIGSEQIPPTSSPTSSPSSDAQPPEGGAAPTPPGGDGGGVRQRTLGTDPYLVRVAVQRGDLLGIVRGFRANARADRVPDWLNACGGMQLGEVVAILHSNDAIGRRIREPSGFRRALDVWQRLDLEERRRIGLNALDAMGIPHPRPTPET